VIEPDLVEGIFEREAALNFVRLDHGREHVAHGQWRLARGDGVARAPIGGSKNGTDVVGRVPPFRRQPAVVEIEPADHGADIEGGLHGIELELRARHPGAIRYDRSRHDGSQELPAGGIAQRRKRAAKRINETMACRLIGERARDLISEHIIGDIGKNTIRLRSDIAGPC
jgi:hypothetical protein